MFVLAGPNGFLGPGDEKTHSQWHRPQGSGEVETADSFI